MHPKGSVVISFGANKGRAGEGVEFFWIFWFPMCSQHVPQVLNVFPHMFPIASHFYPISFGISFYSCNQYKQPKKETTIYLILGVFKLRFFDFLGVIGQSKMPITKRKNFGGGGGGGVPTGGVPTTNLI
jgi:hypothetical protein